MTTLNAVLQSPVVHRLGWSLLHSVWEGAAVALLLAVALSVLRRRAPQARYVASCAAMLGLVALPAATFLLTPLPPSIADAARPPAAVPAAELPKPAVQQIPPIALPPAELRNSPIIAVPLSVEGAGTASAAGSASPAVAGEPAAVPVSPSLPVVTPRPSPRAAAAPVARGWDSIPRLSPAIPWLVLAWAAGVLCLSLWNAGAWLVVRRLNSRSTSPVPAAVELAAAKLAARLGLVQAVRLLQSAVVDSPLVIGFVKPLVLLPVSMLTELPAAQLEALLAHELAHVRRHDYLANLLQVILETLLFYHPAAWRVSSRIRVERENCCDDLAVEVTRDRAAYVRALATVAGVHAPALVPAAAGGDLLARLRRVLGKSDADRPSRWIAGAAVALLLVMAAAVTRLSSSATAGAPAASPATRPSGNPADGALRVVTIEAAPAEPAGDKAPASPLPDGTQNGDCELGGRVVDSSGKAVEGASVYFANQFLHPERVAYLVGQQNPATWRDGIVGPAVVTTDAQGRFAFNLLYPGHSDIWAETPAGCGWLHDVDTDAKGVKIRLAPKTDSLSFEGNVVDTETRPVKGARMLLASGEYESKVLGEATTDEAGNYRIEVARSWSYEPFLRLICVRDKAAVAWRTLPFCSGTGMDIRLEPPTSVRGRITSTTGRPLGDATVWAAGAIAPEYGTFVAEGSLLDVASSVQTDADGSFVLGGIPQGARVTLRARHPDYASANGNEVNTMLAEQHVVNIRLPDGIVIEGTVRLRTTNEPVAGAIVTLGYPAMPPRTTTTDKEGHYRFAGVDEFDGHTHRDVHAKAGRSADSTGSSPQWEGQTYYQKPLKAGQHAMVDLLLERSAGLRLADWKQKPGNPLAGKSHIAILDDADPAFRGKERYADTLTARDPSGKVLWQKSGFNVCGDIGCGHRIIADPDRDSLWLLENAGNRLMKLSRDGTVLWEKPDVGGHAAAIDPKSGDAWILEERGTIYGSSLVVFSPEGAKLHEWGIKGSDIAYSAHDDCFWATGKKLQKIDRNGKVVAEAPWESPWTAVSVSVNERDGSVWIADGHHPNVAESRGRVCIFEPDGRLRKSFSVDWDNRQVIVDAARNTAWIMASRGVFKVDLDGKVLAEIPVGYGSLDVEPDTGYVWFAGREGIWRMDTDGRPVWGEATANSQKWVCLMPSR